MAVGPLPGVGIDSLLHQLAIQALHSVAKVVAMFQLPLLIPIYRFYIGMVSRYEYFVISESIKNKFTVWLGHLSFNTKETVISWPIRRGTLVHIKTMASKKIIILTDIISL